MKRFGIAGNVGEKYEIPVDFGFVEAEDSTSAVDVLWQRLQKNTENNVVSVKSKEDLNRYFSISEKPLRSKVYETVQNIYYGSWSDGGKSFQRLNTALQKTVNACIIAGMKFFEEDFRSIATSFKGGYWFGESNGEHFYSLAIECNNLSACQSYEAYRNRKPFILDNVRIHVGYGFKWADKKGKIWNVKCTSFADNGEYLTACSYKKVEGDKWHREKVEKRFSISYQDLADFRKAKRDFEKAQLALKENPVS